MVTIYIGRQRSAAIFKRKDAQLLEVVKIRFNSPGRTLICLPVRV